MSGAGSAEEARAGEMLRLMITARVLEERLAIAYADGKLPGWIHSCEGHEALGAAIASCLRPDDHLVPHYRSRPEQLGKGMSVREIVAELFATVDGASGGRGGETHVSSVERRIYGMTGVLGASIPIGAGVAMASKLRGTDEVTLTSFGEGTSNRGTFHESLNLAAIWELPVVFLCDNNFYVELSPITDFIRVDSIAERAAGYGIAGRSVDGHDPEALSAALAEAVAAAREGRPSLVEARMMRRRGHWEGDPQAYRPEEEVEALAGLDPVPAYRRLAIAERGVAESDVLAWEAEALREVDEAIEWASSRPRLAREDAFGPVYAEGADGGR